MDALTTDLLMNMPPLMAFAAYLIWQTQKQQKRLDGWMAEMKTIDDKSQEREDKIRARYDDVLAKVEGERAKLIDSLSTKISDMNATFSDLRSDIKALFARFDHIEKDVDRLRLSGGKLGK